MSSPLKQNTATIQELLNTINSLPEAGTDLPELTNEGSASDLLSGKQLIDSDGNIVTGTIATKTASNLIASGATVTVPAGYYATQATKSVSTGSAKTPATTITKNPTISVDSSGKITASVSGTQNVTPTVTAGYVSSGTAGIITVSGSATKQLTTQAAKTVTPTKSSQTAVASGVYTTGAVTVKGDSNLVAGNIKSGVNIFGVTGTYAGSCGSGGDTSMEDGLVTGTITEYSNNRVASVGSYAFQRCSRLTSVSFPKVTRINKSAFQSCSSLTTLYLTGSSLCSLAASTAFTSTGIGSNKGYIYVPSSLVVSYKAATNWAFFSNRIYSYLG